MPSAELLFRLANVVLAASAPGMAALIIRAIHHRASRRVEPLGVVFALVFLGIGLRAAVRVWATPWTLPEGAAATLIAVDWLAAGATFTFLLLRRRYAVFIETAGLVREYETEYAQKEREAQALAQVNEELRRLDQLKSEFLAMVSHELRTPLTAIIGYSRLLTRQVHGPLTSKQLEHQEAIFRGAQRLSDLINDLLDVSRLEAGRVELNPRPTHVRHVVDQVITVVTVAAQAKQIRIENAVPSDLPLVQADPSRLQQILVNLVGNGVKFSSSAGLVRVTAGRQREQVWVAVEDRGVGIPKDELARIWDPFYQVEDVLGGVGRVCDDGEQGIREAMDRVPSLILLDLMLPRVSGWEVARRLRQVPRTASVRIIAVSALSRSQERAAALHAGCDAYLTKPFTPDELARIVATAAPGQAVRSNRCRSRRR